MEIMDMQFWMALLIISAWTFIFKDFAFNFVVLKHLHLKSWPDLGWLLISGYAQTKFIFTIWYRLHIKLKNLYNM